MEVELSGESIPYAVVVHPLAVVVTGNILIGTTVRRPLQMANYRSVLKILNSFLV